MPNPTRMLPVIALVGTIASCGGSSDGDVSATAQPVTTPPLVASNSVGTLPGTFAVGDDGAASYAIPLETPPGRAGIEPTLALTYSSRGGNGLAGMGWSVGGFSQIMRCGRSFWRDGEVRPVQLGAADNICLDGTPLIAVAQDAGVLAPECASTQKQEFRTEPDSARRIVACGLDPSGPLSWLVYDKDGRIRRYGGTTDSRLDVTSLAPDANGNSGGPVLRRPGWLIDRVQDRAGNYLTYIYGRFNAPEPDKLEWWPVRIDYTGFGATAPNRSVVFSYGYAVEDETAARPDAWSTYLRGVEVMHTKILKSVTTIAPSVTEQPQAYARKYMLAYTTDAFTRRALLSSITMLDGLGGGMPPTRFTYSTAAASFARTVQGAAPAISRVEALSGSDVNDDGKDDLLYTDALNGVRTDYVRIAGGSVDFPAYGASVASPQFGSERTTRIPYEATDDGKADVISDGCTATGQRCDAWDDFGNCTFSTEVCTETSAILYSSDGAGHFTEGVHAPMCSGVGQCGHVRAVADVNGDHFADIVRNYDAILDFRSVEAAPFVLANPLARSTAISGPIKHADMDGDGAVDFLWPYGYGTGKRYDALHVRGPAAAPHVEATALGLDLTDNNCQVFADVNGDGLTDVVDVASGAMVRLNRGDGRFSSAQSWSSSFTGTPICAQAAMAGAPWLGWKTTAVFPVDYDQDGMQDLLILQPVTGYTTSARVLVSTGHSFLTVALDGLNTGIQLDCASTSAPPAATTLDANGDGLFDVVFVCPDSTTGTGGSFRLYKQQAGADAAGRPDVLIEITDGLGARRRVDYKPLTDLSVYTHPTTSFVQPLLVASNESVDDGDGNLIEVAQHVYEDGTATADSEGWLGFRHHTRVDPRTGTRHRVELATDGADHRKVFSTYLGGRTFHPWKGTIVEEVDWVTVGSVVRASRTRRTLTASEEIFANGAADYVTSVAGTVVETFETPASSFSPDAPGTALTSITTTTQTNPCGDPVAVTVTRAPGVSETTTRTYSAAAGGVCDLGASWLDFLSFERTTSTANGTSQTREVSYVAEPDGTGRVRDTIRQPSGTWSQRLCTRVVARDGFGNPRIVDRTAGTCNHDDFSRPQDRSRTTTTTYDADGVHAITVVDSLGLTTRRKVHPGLGVVYETTDADGRVTRSQLDGFGRPYRVDRPDGTWTQVGYVMPGWAVFGGDLCAGGGYTNAQFALIETTSASDGSGAITCRDRLGRARRTATRGFGGTYSYVDTVFDSDGTAPHDKFPERVYQVSRPHALTAPSQVASQTSYDAAGRVVSSCTGAPGAPGQVTACTTTTYAGLTTDVCEPGGVVWRRTVRSPAGPVASTSTFPGAASCGSTVGEARTSFTYGPFDNLVRIADPAGNVVTQTFDPIGNRLRLVDPDLGTTTSPLDGQPASIENTYSAFGEPLTSVDAAGVTTAMTYDLGGRLYHRSYGTVDDFTWGATRAKTQLASSSWISSSTTYSRGYTYDTLGRLETATLGIDGTTYTTSTTYDAQGRVATTTSPDLAGLGRVVVRNEYDVAGQLSRLELGRASATCTATSQCQSGETCLASLGNVCGREIWRATAVDAEQRLTGEQLGNGVTTTRTYSGGYLTSIVTGTVQNDSYTYLDNGNLASRTVSGVTESFAYDGAGRLKSAQVAGRAAVTWQYDALGNLTFASDVVPTSSCPGGATLQYTQTTPWGAVGPHALSGVVCGSTTTSFRHDAKGNHTTGLASGDAYTWTVFNKLATATSGGESWTLGYDADHTRVKKVRTSGSATPWHTVIHAGMLERRLKTTGEQDVVRVQVGTATLELVWDWNGTSGTQALQYVHPDRLGSPEVITSATGALVERKSFDAWGNPRAIDLVGAAPSPSKTTTGFTGHLDDTGISTGGKAFVDMGGRVYSPYLKRFWSPDPFVQAPKYGPSWNRFAYAFDNPLAFTDPSGYLFNYSSGGLVGMGIIQLVDGYGEQQAYEGDWMSTVKTPGGQTYVMPHRDVSAFIAADMAKRTEEQRARNAAAEFLHGLALEHAFDTSMQLGLSSTEVLVGANLSSAVAAWTESTPAATTAPAASHATSHRRGHRAPSPSERPDYAAQLWGGILYALAVTTPAYVANEHARMVMQSEQMRRAMLTNPTLRALADPKSISIGVSVDVTAIIGTTGGSVGVNRQWFPDGHGGMTGENFLYLPKAGAGASIGVSASFNMAIGEGAWTGEFRSFNAGCGPVSLGVFNSPDYSWVGMQNSIGIGPLPCSGSYTVTDYSKF